VASEERIGLVEKVSEATWSESSEKTGLRGEKASGEMRASGD